jgi:hypothetical protein
MSDGAKIAIAVGAVAVVGYFVLRPATPAPQSTRTTTSANTSAWVSGIIQGVGSLFRTSPSPAGPTGVGSGSLAPTYSPPLTSAQLASVAEFRSESPDMTDAERDAAILG